MRDNSNESKSANDNPIVFAETSLQEMDSYN